MIMFLAPQSPHRYSTPRMIIGGGRTADAEEDEGVGAEWPPLVGVEFMMFVSFKDCWSGACWRGMESVLRL